VRDSKRFGLLDLPFLPILGSFGFAISLASPALAQTSFDPAPPKQRPSAEAPGAPGHTHTWAPALKQAVGTAFESQGARSPVWFTMAEGILTEVHYPTVDAPQIGDLQFLVTDGSTFFSEQRRDVPATVTYRDGGPTAQSQGTDRTGMYSIEQEVVTDPDSPVVRLRARFKWHAKPLRVFVLLKPALGNRGADNQAWAERDVLTASRSGQPVSLALTASVPFLRTSAGFSGTSCGWTDLSRHRHLTHLYSHAGPGSVALVGELPVPDDTDSFTVDLALAFASGTRASASQIARNALQTRTFDQVRQAYEASWQPWLSSLRTRDNRDRRSAMTIKMHEDKKNRGAIIASLSKPGAPESERSWDNIGGYHLVWPRDLYHAAMGLLAVGDTETPKRVLEYLVKTQRPDGSWYQNFWIDGSAYWKGLQLDEVAYPILLGHQLLKRGLISNSDETRAWMKKASSFLLARGPITQQDRWEEIGGFVPATLAAVIAGLRVSTQWTGEARYAHQADLWAANLEDWTSVSRGPHGRDYYLRVSPGGQPDLREPILIANGGGEAIADEILDGGFLELARLGVRPAQFPTIQNTIRAMEAPLTGISGGFELPGGARHYRRYNRDAYGTDRMGGYWPLLGGERGIFAVIEKDLPRARAQLRALSSAALPSGLIPEQTIDAGARPKAGAGVACPLVWAHAEELVLRRSIEEGIAFDSP